MSSEEPSVPAVSTPLGTLLEVQDLDTRISQLQHRKATLEERRQLAEVEESLAALDRRQVVANSSRAELVERQDDLEAQIAATASRRTAIERRLYAARGAAARDLQAMDEELGHLRTRRDELEDQELEIMVALEPIDADLAEIGSTRTQLVEQADALRSALAGAERVIDAELSERITARTAVADKLPDDLHRRYDALRARLGGTGAARLVGNRCSGCHLELPSMEVERFRHLPPGTVVTCEQCGRILVPSAAGTPGGQGGDATPGAAR